MDFESALHRLQQTELEILKVFASFCEEHDIQWFIDSGTVLGAMRHGGFIPWDDDIDVGMERAEYERFLSCAAKDFPRGYSIHTSNNTPGFAGMFAKIYKDGTLFETAETREAGLKQGIFVDIFPYDYVAADPRRAAEQRRQASFWQKMSYLYHSGTIVVPHKGVLGSFEKAGCRTAHFLVHALFNPASIERHYNQAVRSEGNTVSCELTCFSWATAKSFPVEILLPAVNVGFEDACFPAPRETERYLEKTYGEWRVLPAPENRRTHLPQVLDFGDGEVWEA